MLYESYKNKLEKRKRRFERFWRFRLLFLLAVLMTLAAIGALMGVAGQVTKVSVPERFSYGEPLSMQASTVFGGAGFEYRLQGTEQWSDKMPRAAGIYECRAVGKSIVGTSRPGDTYLFTIDPVETVVRVADGNLVYGEEPSFSADLCYDDVLHVSRYTIEEKGGVYNVIADLDAVSVVSAEGEDVTASYTLGAKDRDVIEIARPLTVRTASAAFEYDGKPHADEALTLEGYGLAEGHTIEAEFASLTDAGTMQNRPVAPLRILDENGGDVTDKYAITLECGTLEVQKRKLTVTTKAETFVYDGETHTYDDLTAEGLVSGQKAVRAGMFSVQDAGEYTNAPQYEIFDGENRTTDNYEIAENFGAVTVTRRPLTVTTEGDTLPYDGKEHTYDGLTAEGLAGEQKISRTGALSVLNAGDHKNTPVYVIQDASGEHEIAKSNYDITENFGTVTVTKLAITVEMKPDAFTYDGQAHEYKTEEWYTLEGVLAEGEAPELSDTLTARAAGTYTSRPTVRVMGPHGETSQNYEISVIEASVTIAKRALTVTTESETLTYDGTEHVYNDIEAAEAASPDGGLAGAQELRRSDIKIWRAAGQYTNEPAYDIFDGEEKVTENYEITPDYGTVTIKRCELTVTTATERFVYDGKPHTYDTVDFGETALMAGDEIRLSGVYTFTEANAEPYSNHPGIAIFFGEEDVTESYNITFTYGTVTIERRHVKFRTDSLLDQVYDGTPYSAPHYDDLGTEESSAYVEGAIYPLADGHTLAIDYPSRTAAGEEKNIPTAFRIESGGAEISLSNYVIEWEYGTLEIVKRAITLKTGSLTVTYDGGLQSAKGFEECAELVPGHTVTATGFIEKRDAARYDNVIDKANVTIWDAEHNDVTPNYEITEVQSGTIVIDKREVTLLTGSDEVTYDAKEHKADTFTAQSPLGIVEGHSVAADFKTWTEANEEGYENSFDEDAVQIRDADGGDVTANYTISWQWGTVVILKRHMRVTSDSDSRVYDGQAHSVGTYKAEAFGGDRGLAEGHIYTATVSETPSFTNVRDTGENKLGYSEEFIGAEDGENCIANYEIEYVNGTVEITKRPATVTTESHSFIYDGTEHPFNDIAAENLAKDQWVERTDELIAKTVKEGGYENRPTVQIFADSGETTDNYTITYVCGTVTVEKRPLHLLTATDSFVYDGTAHTYGVETVKVTDPEENENAGLAEGQEKRIVDNAEDKNSVYFFTEARGEKEPYINQPVVHVFDGPENVTENYDITYDYGTVTIDFRPLRFTSGTENFIYDDTEKSHWAIVEAKETLNLAEDHDLVIIGGTTLIEVDEKDNVLLYHITDKDGKEVTNNYTIEQQYGTISVAKRHVKFRSGSITGVEYDADPHGAPEYEDLGSEEGDILKLVEWHAVSADYPTRTVVGKEYNIPENVKIVKGSDDVTENYVIEAWELGEIEILQRKVSLETDSESFVYDASEHAVKSYTEKENTLVAAHGHTLSAVYPARVTVGTTVNEATQVKIFEGDADVTENYDISWAWGNVVVTVRPVTITSDGGEHVYDDEDFSVPTYTVEEFNEEEHSGLVTGHIFTADVTAPVLHDVETRSNELQYENIKVMAGGEEVTGNYQFIEGHRPVAVLVRPVTITTGSGTFVYDGEMHSVRTYTVEAFDKEAQRGLVGGHIFSADEVETSPVVSTVTQGTVINIFNLTNIKVMAGEKPVTANYKFVDNYTYGTLRITPRPVTVTVGGGEKVYNGKPQKCENFETDRASDYAEEPENRERGLLEGHIVRPSFPAYLDAGTYLNELIGAPSIVGALGREVSDNYTVTVGYTDDHRFAILRRPITVSDLVGGTFVYDGKPHASDPHNFTCEEEGADRGLLSSLGHTFIGADGVEVTNVTDIMTDGVYTQIGYAQNGLKNQIQEMSQDTWYVAEIRDASGVNVWENYKVEPGTFEPLRVKPRITVYLYNYSKWYDGTPLSYDPLQENYFIASLPCDVEEAWVRVTLGGSVTEIKSLKAEDVLPQSVCTVMNGETDLTAENGFTFVSGDPDAPSESAAVLTVTRRPLWIHVTDYTAENKGEPYTYEGDEGSYWFTFGGLLGGHTLTCTVSGTLDPEQFSALITLSEVKIEDREGNDVTDFYDVKVTPGTLSWAREEPEPDETETGEADIKRRTAE